MGHWLRGGFRGRPIRRPMAVTTPTSPGAALLGGACQAGMGSLVRLCYASNRGNELIRADAISDRASSSVLFTRLLYNRPYHRCVLVGEMQANPPRKD